MHVMACTASRVTCAAARRRVAETLKLKNRVLEPSQAAGLGWIDTAEVYGFGKSEEFLGDFMRDTGSRPQVTATGEK